MPEKCPKSYNLINSPPSLLVGKKMRPIEKKIRYRINELKKEQIKKYSRILINKDIDIKINELERVLSELQKESDLMQELLEAFEEKVNIDVSIHSQLMTIEISEKYYKHHRIAENLKLIEKVKKEMSDKE